jgi:signal transduction histidine kinase
VYNQITVSALGAVQRTDWKTWLRPPRPLLLTLFSFTLVSISVLAWFATRLIDQERLLEAQRAQERLEQEADRLLAIFRGALAQAGERLDTWDGSGQLPEGALLLVLKNGSIDTFGGQLLFSPMRSPIPEADPSVFLEAELIEFAQARPKAALEIYRRLAPSRSPAIRAGALVRIARIYRRIGNSRAAQAAYRELAAIPNAKVAGAPADLLARAEMKDASLAHDLLNGRWQITREQFEFYWSEASKSAPAPEAMALSEAAAIAVENRRRGSAPRGEETVWAGNRAFFALWRRALDRTVVLISKPESLLPAESGDAAFALSDAEGRLVMGSRDAHQRAAVRTAAEAQIPWTIYVTSLKNTNSAGLAERVRFLTMGVSVMIAFLLLGTYFIGRAIRREAQAARIQSDFVSAVSHEFRSPLTSMRQLSELLAAGRLQSEDRRQLYYETLVKETTRLQRLVESLLNFGRMEAGARQYVFEALNVAQVVERVVSEFEPQLAGSGRRIEVIGSDPPCLIEADPDAISMALRNLLDNALKYSPDNPAVWVEWKAREDFVAIEVRDRGRGIAESERRAIFQKFVRGSAAAATNVKGSGVGLAMVRHIVSAHGGAITVTSQPGRGSAFTILLRSAERA